MLSQSSENHKHQKSFKVFVPHFNQLEIYGECAVILKQDSVCKLEIITDKKSFKAIDIDHPLDKLVIKDGSSPKSKQSQFIIHYRHLNQLTLHGAVSLKEYLLCGFDSLEVELNGRSELKLELSAKQLKVKQNGQSHFRLSGECKTSRFELSQYAVLFSQDLHSQYINMYLTQYAKAKIRAEYTLRASLDTHTRLDVFGKTKDPFVRQAEGSQLIYHSDELGKNQD
ncbi:MAG: GIN domain-containing protein [Flavobacteriales bacterium]